MKYYLGLDNGGTTTKASVITEMGEELGTVSVSTKSITPCPGFVERDMEEMWQANCSVVREVLKKTGILKEEISGVGICGHGKGLYLWGKDGKPARHGVISSDNRAYEYVNRWKNDGTDEKAFAVSHQHVMACQPVSLLAWLKDHEPAVLENVQWVFECKDYVRFRLTGEAKGELTDYSGANLVNLKTRSYDDGLLKLFGIEEIKGALPPLCLAAETAGYVTEEAAGLCGLKAGTPVVGGMFDIDACALAVNVVDEENLCVIAGTWSINEYLSRHVVTGGNTTMNSLFCLPEYYLIEESSATSAGNNEWFMKHFLSDLAAEEERTGKSRYDILNAWVENVPPCEFVPVFLPFLMASNVHPNAKGSFVGMSVSHNRTHLARSVYEGITFCHKYHIDKLLSARKDVPKKIRLAGGAARSEVWTQMFADILGIPVETAAVNETGALGCAIAAAVGTGRYKSLSQASAAMCRIGKTVFPNQEYSGTYQKKYHLYRKTIESLDGLWDDMQELAES